MRRGQSRGCGPLLVELREGVEVDVGELSRERGAGGKFERVPPGEEVLLAVGREALN
jgi:hypothetical protein